MEEALDAIHAAPRRTLRVIAGVAAVAAVVVYELAVRTAWGQRLDATALSGRRELRARAVHAAARLLTTIDVAALLFLGGAIVLVALLRARPRLAFGAGCVIAGSILTTEVLKRVVLTRPNFGIVDALHGSQTYPSGHTTVAMSLGSAALLVAPERWRTPVGLAGAAYASGIGVAVVATANHRPSDPIGAALVVTVWAAVIAAMLAEPDRPARGAGGRSSSSRAGVIPWIALAALGLLVVAFVGLAATVVAIRSNRLHTVELGGAFAASATAIAGTIMLATAALLMVLRGVALDRPRTHMRAWNESES
ncbi:MAG: phosphatase PAP2 family protein [Actinobacteria bacterium]|nr:phosphatase PAP2 family protein [Actinomycetota bacterium]